MPQFINKEEEKELFYSKENMLHLRKSIKDLEEGKGVEHSLIDVENNEEL